MDLNDRKFTEPSRYDSEFFPRCPCKSLVKVTGFGDLELDTAAGWYVEFTVSETKMTKAEDPHYDPLPEVGKKYRINLRAKIAPKPFQKQKEGQTLRTLLAALVGVEHTPQFDANEALVKVMAIAKAEKLDALPEIVLDRRVKIGKEKEDGGKYVNETDFFEVAA